MLTPKISSRLPSRKNFYGIGIGVFFLAAAGILPGEAENGKFIVPSPDEVHSLMSLGAEWFFLDDQTVWFPEPPRGDNLAALDLPAPLQPREENCPHLPDVSNLAFSAAVVGPSVLLTAAHNLDDQQDPPKLRGTRLCCDSHPEFQVEDPSSPDIALCHRPGDLSRSTYGTIDFDPGSLQRGNEVLLTGFGCEEPGEPRSGCLGFQLARVRNVPKNGEHVLRADWNLCGGHSGGPGYIVEGSVRRDVLPRADQNRRIVGVISREEETRRVGQAILTVTSSPAVSEWIKQWARGEAPGQRCGAGIVKPVCGIDLQRRNLLEGETGNCSG